MSRHRRLQYGPSPDETNFETPPPIQADETGNYPLPMPGKRESLVAQS